ncbi:MAG: hypothetical protein WA324_13025 [Bryobacteraceae bacterium]
MRCDWSPLIIGFILCTPCFAGDIAPDTARLAAHLERFRHHTIYELSATEDKAIQHQYLNWINSRLKTGLSVARMNGELDAAKLLSNGPESVSEMFDKTYAGFLGEIEAKPVPPAEDLLAITFGIYTGGDCNLDETLLLYGRKPLRRLAQVNGERSYTHGYELRDFAIGKDNTGHGRMIGSAWVASNCTSNWNGNRFRIDLLRGGSIDNVLDRDVSAYGDDKVKIRIEDNTVTFRYTTLMRGDVDALTRAGIACYRVQDGHATREAPLATSFASFINEWLEMDDAEAARWSSPEASMHHHLLAAKAAKQALQWEHVAACPGPSPTREISLQWSASKQTTVFRIGGSSAAELRMLSVSDRLSPSCRQIDISAGLSSIVTEPMR